MTYTIKAVPTIPFGFIFGKTFKKVKGHFFAKDMPSNIIVIVFEDERRVYLDINKYILEFSRENFLILKENADKEKSGAK